MQINLSQKTRNEIDNKLNHKKYWIEKFHLIPPPLKLPLDFRKLIVKKTITKNIEIELDDSLIKNIENVAILTKSTLHNILLTTYKILLHKYTGQEDIVVGLPLKNNINTENKYNTLALRSNPCNNKRVVDYLIEIDKNIEDAYKNQDYQIKELIDVLKSDNTLSEDGLFKTIFAMQNSKYTNYENIYLQQYYENNMSIQDIALFCNKTNNKVSLLFEYNAALFTQDTIKRFSSHYKNILIEIISNINIKISDIDMLSTTEKNQIIYDFNNTKKEYPRDKTLKELFEEQVEKTPKKIAVVSEKNKLTYEELNQKANVIAKILRDKGIKPDTIVGIMVDKSVEMIIGITAIIKSGGAYLPLDPNYPKERIEYIVQDSKPTVILTREKFEADIDFNGDIIVLSNKELYNESVQNFNTTITPDNLSYIIYTSGTTGNPKGVMNKHRNAVRLVKNVDYMNFKEHDKILQMGSLVFDASVYEIWGSLLNGLELHLIKKEIIVLTELLHKYIIQNKITIIFSTPELLNQLAEENVNVFKELRCLLSGGDVLSPKYSSLILKNCPNLDIINAYGPTENGTFSTTYKVEKEFVTTVPIGKPMSNSKAYIVDNNCKLKPIGCYGELCVSGDGLSRGYLNKPDLTAKKFIDNPFVIGTKMYKTGDLARWLPDGNIEFAGRKDYQVKIRGFRIELGEVESFLTKLKEIKEGIVLVKRDQSNNKYMCAYVTTNKKITTQEIREKLLNELPKYMVPSHFVKLDKMPLTPTGKIDRKALFNLDVKINTDTNYVSPTNDIQIEIAKIWENVLGIEKVGINDDFFELGGNSLNAIRVISSLTVNYEINTNDIFKYPTIKELSQKLILKKNNLKNKFTKIKEIFENSNNTSLSENIKLDYDNYKKIVDNLDNTKLKESIHYNNILLTGASGYLGINLLYEILNSSNNCKVFIVIRGVSLEIAKKRFKDKFKFYFGNNLYEKYSDRIIILNGDLTKDNFGLDNKKYLDLSKEIDCIINAAANVKHYGIYNDFYNINVEGTQRLIDFATIGNRKDIKHISTMSVGSGIIENKKETLFTEYDCDMSQKTENYYVKTKFLAEKLILDARNKGLNTSIFRIGNLMFNSNTGTFQQNINDNAFYTLIKSLIKIGNIPNLNINSYDFSFVDDVRKAFVLLYNKKVTVNGIYHLSNPNTVSLSLIGDYINLSNIGYFINKMETSLFLDYLYENYNNIKIKRYIEDFLLHSEMFDISNHTNFVNVSDKTNKYLKSLEFNWLELNKNHIKKMLKYCDKINYFNI